MDKMQNRIFHTIACMVIAATGVFAGPITFTFSGPIAGTPGSTITVSATAVNTTNSLLFLNGDGFTVQSPFAQANFDDGLFAANWFSVAANSSFGPQGIFTIKVPSNIAPGLYTETYNLFGGTGVNDQNLLASTQFQVQVQAPEPATGISMALGLGGLAIVAMRARKRTQA